MTKILIAEDDPVFRNYLANKLQEAGNAVITAEDGKIAREKLFSPEYLPSEAPDDQLRVFISDNCMPGMTGRQLLELVSGDPRLKHIRFILMSAIDSDDKGDLTLACERHHALFVSKDDIVLIPGIVASLSRKRPVDEYTRL